MSISTILGVLFGLGLVVGSIAISTDNLASFISIPSMLIVVGGTLAASFIGFQARYVIQALKDIGALVKKETVNRNILTQETGKIIRWGFLVKKNGISSTSFTTKKISYLDCGRTSRMEFSIRI